MTVAVRDDDADLLTDLRRVTGLGRVSAKRAQGTSRPQACWTVASKRECAELARILRALSAAGPQAPRFRGLGARGRSLVGRPVRRAGRRPIPCPDGPRRRALRLVRRYVKSPPACARRLRSRPAGLPRRLLLRRRLLRAEWAEAARGRQAAPRRPRDPASSSPSASASGPSATILRTATPTRWLRGSSAPTTRSARRSASSRPLSYAVASAASSKRGGSALPRTRADADRRRAADRGARTGRCDRHGRCAPSARRRSCWPRGSRPGREAYIDVLRAFADEVPDGRLTCTAYAHARASHPEWPTRNTLALAFGSWEQALGAAGLGARASSWRHDRA